MDARIIELEDQIEQNTQTINYINLSLYITDKNCSHIYIFVYSYLISNKQ